MTRKPETKRLILNDITETVDDHPCRIFHVPGHRTEDLTPGCSGEKFRDRYLIPALQEFETVEVNLAGTEGLCSGWLEEAFGGAIRKGAIIGKEEIGARLIIKNDEELHVQRDAYRYMKEAIKERSQFEQ